jgi:ABC-type uncharacterized transport system permease subunit
MNAFLDEYRTQAKIALLLNLQYRTAMLIWLIGLVLEPGRHCKFVSDAAQCEHHGVDRVPACVDFGHRWL